MTMAAIWPWRLLLLLVVLAPLPLGGNRPWAWSLEALLAGIALAGWALAAVRGQVRTFWRAALWPSVIGFAAALAWGAVQLLPVPASLAHPLWPSVVEVLGTSAGASISIAPGAVGPALLRLASYGAIFWLALQYARDRRHAHELVTWVTAASVVYALYGLVNFFAGNTHLLWYPRWAYATDVTGTFVNRNSYATFAGLGLLAAVAMAIRTFREKWRVADRSLARFPRGVESFMGRPLVYSFGALVIGMAWLQSHSRMGFGATVVGLAALLLVLRAAGVVRHFGLAATIGVAGLGFLIFSSGALTFDRIEQATSADRLPLFAMVIEGIRAAPWTGHGFGSFPVVFPMFRDLTIPQAIDFTQAHNSYLELAFELGVPVATLLVAAVVWAALLCARGVFRRSRDRLVPALGFAAALLVGTHALVDFSLQMPAVAYLFAALLGAGVAQSWSPGDGASRRPARAE